MAAESRGVPSGGRGGTRRAGHLLPLPRAGEPATASLVSRGGSLERQVGKTAADPDGVFSGGTSTRHADRHLPIPRAGESTATSRVSHGGSSERQAVKMAADPHGVSSCGRGGTRRTNPHPPLLRTGEPTATSRVSRGSSSRPSNVSVGAARRTAADEAMGKRVVLAADAVGGRGGPSSPSCGGHAASSLTHHRSAPLPVSSRGGSNGHKTHGSDDASSLVISLRLHEEQERISNRTTLLKAPPIQRIIRSPAARHASPANRRAEMGSQVPPRFSNRQHQHVGAIGATNAERPPRISEKENDLDGQKYKQIDRVPSRILSDRDWNSECGGVYEGNKYIADFKKPCALPRNVKLQAHRHPSLLSSVEKASQVSPRFIHYAMPDRSRNSPRIGAIDAMNEPRVPNGCSKQYSPVTTRNKLDGVPLRKGLTTSAKGSIQTSGGIAIARKKVAYASTLGVGGGYGDPHPPPFYKCKVCCKRTAFFRLKCCHLVLCDHCGCDCDVEGGEDKELQFWKDGQQSNKELLPKVKFQGTDLFLWQPFSYPADLMLCLAKRAGYQLLYYFAPVHELMDSRLSVINTTVYSFHQVGRNARSLKVTEELISRDQLH